MKKILLPLLTILIFIFGFQIQESQKYYYSFNQKIPLIDIENKIVIRYSKTIAKEEVASSLRRRSPEIIQSWQDERTVVLQVPSSAKREKAVEELNISPDVISTQPLFKINSGLELMITDEFVIRFKANVLPEQQNEINRQNGVLLIKNTETYQLLSVPKGVDALEVANKYQESGLVEFSHPNFLARIEKHQQVIPNDPFFVNQFTLNNTGQVINDGHIGVPDADIDAPECWAMTAGTNAIIVAVLDQGVSDNHPDLPNARQIRLNGSNFGDGDPNNPAPTGNSNHGNSCAGVIAATQNNNEGIAGICPNCRIMPIRIFNADETGIPSNRLADAIDFARNNGADIISNSWGFNSDDPNLFPVIVTAIQNATNLGRGGRGCVVLFSASNSARHTQGVNGQVQFPSNVNIAGVVTVGASDRNDTQSDYSPTSNPGSPNNQIIDIVAPSHRAYPPELYARFGLTGGIAGETFEAWSIDVPGNVGYNPWPEFTSPGNLSVNPPVIGEQLPNAGVNFQAYTGRFGGTSHSCPVVAGVAALVLSVNPNLTQMQVFNILISNADQVGGVVYTNGRSNELGSGRVNACRAVTAAFNTISSIANTGQICTSITLTGNNIPPNSPISWSTTDTNALNVNPTTGVATRVNNYNGFATLVGTVTAPGNCSSYTIQKSLFVGLPLANNSTLIYPSGYRGVDPVTLCAGCTYNFLVDFVAGATSYTWVLPSGFSFVSGRNTSTPGIKTASASGTYTMYCSANNSCGSSWTHSLTINIGSGGGQQQMIAVYPNPTSTDLTIESTQSDLTISNNSTTESSLLTNDTFSAKLIDQFNSELRTGISVNGRIVFDVRNIKKGIYYLHVIHGQELIVRQIIIDK